MLLSLGRIIKFSLQDIVRNIWLSLVTVIILVLALFTVNMLLVVKVIGDTAVGAIKEKIDVNLYLESTADEDAILALKARVAALPQVRSVSYVSKAEALEVFKAAHADNPDILEALKQLGANPLTPSLIIKPANLEEFDHLINQINSLQDDIIESRNFTNYKVLLSRVNNITQKVSSAGLTLSLIFIAITTLVVFNSVRVAIYTHKREIQIMRLVGASRGFIQMPYLLSGVIYTLVGVSAVMLVYYPFLSLLQPYLETFFVGYNVDLITYFYDRWYVIFGAQFVAASFINIVAGYLAVRQYSQV